MKKKLFYILIILCSSCKLNPTDKPQSDSTSNIAYKTLSEIKLTLLDARNEKAELFLGKPDVKGRITLGGICFMVYYSKVMEGNTLKHLVLFINGSNGINQTSPIYKIEAVSDGDKISGAGNFAHWLQVSKRNIQSNSTDFNYGNGNLKWFDVFSAGTGEIKPTRNVYGGTKMVSSLTDLPIPSETIKNTAIKKYTVTGLTARQIYVWYAEHYHAQIKDYQDNEHKYLGIPFNPNDTCILLKMTGAIDGSIQLEFSFECG